MTDREPCRACEGTGVGNGNKMGGFCKRCDGSGWQPIEKPEPQKPNGVWRNGARVRR